MNYEQALRFIYSLQGENLKLRLAGVRHIVARLPFPVDEVRYLQVAGTNGKGSTSHFLAAVLQAAGLRVGLFTSPHLEHVRERIRIDGRPVSQAKFAAAIDRVRAICDPLVAAGEIDNFPTFFETVFLASLCLFHEEKCDWAVMEVGLGGRLDATTALTPAVGVITNIALDHTQILGRRIVDIAAEKAGIIKSGVPLVCGCPPGGAAERVIAARARELAAPYFPVFARQARPEILRYFPRSTRARYLSPEAEHRFVYSLGGDHQASNAAVAIRTIEVLRGLGLEIPPAALERGLRRAFIPGRLERFPGSPPVILDGGHNLAGITVLTAALARRNVRDATLVFGVLADKSYRRMIPLLLPFFSRVILTTPRCPRAYPPAKLVPLFAAAPSVEVVPDPEEALALAKKHGSLIIITGSLYLIGELRTGLRRRRR